MQSGPLAVKEERVLLVSSVEDYCEPKLVVNTRGMAVCGGSVPSALFMEGHLDKCTCHPEGVSPSKLGSCPVENKVEGTVTLTQCITNLGALYIQLFAHEESAATDDRKEHGVRSQKTQSLSWLLCSRVLRSQTGHTNF